jgi:hypothetical protein
LGDRRSYRYPAALDAGAAARPIPTSTTTRRGQIPSALGSRIARAKTVSPQPGTIDLTNSLC